MSEADLRHERAASDTGQAVLLHICSGHPSTLVMAAAAELAHALQAEMRSLFVEDEQLLGVACLSCAREVSLTGRGSRAMTLAQLESDMRFASSAVRREIERIAASLNIQPSFEIVRDAPGRALANAAGDGIIIALAEPLGSADLGTVRQLLDLVPGLAGLLLAGQRIARLQGPVVMLGEPGTPLRQMSELARRLVSPLRPELRLLLAAEGRDALAELEAAALGFIEVFTQGAVSTQGAGGAPPTCRLALVDTTVHGAAAVVEALRRIGCGFVVGHMQGLLEADSPSLRRIAGALECPLLLLR